MMKWSNYQQFHIAQSVGPTFHRVQSTVSVSGYDNYHDENMGPEGASRREEITARDWENVSVEVAENGVSQQFKCTHKSITWQHPMWERAEMYSRQSVWQMKRGTSLICTDDDCLRDAYMGRQWALSGKEPWCSTPALPMAQLYQGGRDCRVPPWPPRWRLVAPMKPLVQLETLPAPQQIPHCAVILQHTDPGNTPCFLILCHLRFSLPLHRRESRANEQDHWGKGEKRCNNPWITSS